MTALAAVDVIKRKSLHDELVERVRDLIVEGQLQPGSKVPERELCERFGVSRTPMREALKVLAVDGLVTLVPNRGAIVSAVTLEDLEEAFPVMGALEALSGELAANRITDEEVSGIERLHDQMVQHYKARNLSGYFQVNQAIHEMILEAAGNETLKTQYNSLAAKVRRARYLANMSEDRWQSAVREHEDMLAALKARDGKALGAVLKQHLANKFETVRDWLKQSQA